tara:strand:+ start:1237 stop:3033 length:1797 start_codon:yes stop_codon:yes gene_type:complete
MHKKKVKTIREFINPFSPRAKIDAFHTMNAYDPNWFERDFIPGELEKIAKMEKKFGPEKATQIRTDKFWDANLGGEHDITDYVKIAKIAKDKGVNMKDAGLVPESNLRGTTMNKKKFSESGEDNDFLPTRNPEDYIQHDYDLDDDGTPDLIQNPQTSPVTHSEEEAEIIRQNMLQQQYKDQTADYYDWILKNPGKVALGLGGAGLVANHLLKKRKDKKRRSENYESMHPRLTENIRHLILKEDDDDDEKSTLQKALPWLAAGGAGLYAHQTGMLDPMLQNIAPNLVKGDEAPFWKKQVVPTNNSSGTGGSGGSESGGIDWDSAPASGTPERKAFYDKHNLAYDDSVDWTIGIPEPGTPERKLWYDKHGKAYDDTITIESRMVSTNKKVLNERVRSLILKEGPQRLDEKFFKKLLKTAGLLGLGALGMRAWQNKQFPGQDWIQSNVIDKFSKNKKDDVETKITPDETGNFKTDDEREISISKVENVEENDDLYSKDGINTTMAGHGGFGAWNPKTDKLQMYKTHIYDPNIFSTEDPGGSGELRFYSGDGKKIRGWDNPRGGDFSDLHNKVVNMPSDSLTYNDYKHILLKNRDETGALKK